MIGGRPAHSVYLQPGTTSNEPVQQLPHRLPAPPAAVRFTRRLGLQTLGQVRLEHWPVLRWGGGGRGETVEGGRVAMQISILEYTDYFTYSNQVPQHYSML